MFDVVLTEDQARRIAAADGVVTLRDPRGKIVGYLAPTGPAAADADERLDDGQAYISEVKRRLSSPGRYYTTEEVLENLRSLERQGL